MTSTSPEKMTKTEMTHACHFADALSMVEHDILSVVAKRGGLPEAWDEIARNPGHAKERVTIRLDEDVVKYFRAFGPGWQPKLNQVLRVFMHARLAKMVKGPDTTDFILRAEEVAEYPAPNWGAYANMVEELRLNMEELRLKAELGRFEEGTIKP